jgi:hypothetical protein
MYSLFRKTKTHFTRTMKLITRICAFFVQYVYKRRPYASGIRPQSKSAREKYTSYTFFLSLSLPVPRPLSSRRKCEIIIYKTSPYFSKQYCALRKADDVLATGEGIVRHIDDKMFRCRRFYVQCTYSTYEYICSARNFTAAFLQFRPCRARVNEFAAHLHLPDNIIPTRVYATCTFHVVRTLLYAQYK